MKFDFTKSEVEYFKEHCFFSKEEELILEMRLRNMSIVEISMKIPTSTRTVSRRIKSIKKKIMKVL